MFKSAMASSAKRVDAGLSASPLVEYPYVGVDDRRAHFDGVHRLLEGAVLDAVDVEVRGLEELELVALLLGRSLLREGGHGVLGLEHPV
jgi:hypothetical protein